MTLMAHRKEQVMTASGLDALVGVWLLLSPFILTFVPSQAITNNVIVGIAVAILAIIRFAGAHRHGWISWINVVLGIWVLISPWVLGFDAFSVPTTNNVIVGILVIVLAGWSALATDAGANRSYEGDYRPPPM